MTDFHHSCKETCSGWKQGYEQGRADSAKKRLDESTARVRKTIQKLEDQGSKLKEMFYPKVGADNYPDWWGSTNTKIRRFSSLQGYGTRQVHKNAERHDVIVAAILIWIVCLGFGFAIGVMIGRTQ